MSSVLKIDPRDDVAVALAPLSAGEPVAPGIRAAAAVPAGHKVASRAIAKGAEVRKYGWPTLKLSTNSGLARRKPRWIDFAAGQIALWKRGVTL